jgi:hypothetical protein
MQMRQENGVRQIVTQPARFEAAIDRFTAIDQNRGFAETIQKRGVIAIRARPAVANAETGDGIFHRERFR